MTTGNALLGSPCTWPLLPTALSPDVSTLVYNDLGLTGTIPTELGLYTLVTTLDLSQNQLTGSVPTQLGELVRMGTTFNLATNELTGPVPTELGRVRWRVVVVVGGGFRQNVHP